MSWLMNAWKEGWSVLAFSNYRPQAWLHVLASRPGMFLKFRLPCLRDPGVPKQTTDHLTKDWDRNRRVLEFSGLKEL